MKMNDYRRALIAGALLSVMVTIDDVSAEPVYSSLGDVSSCKQYSGLPSKDVPIEQVWVPGGTFTMGSNTHYPEEAQERKVTVDGFWIDRHEVTNAQFRAFVEATGYKTLAERGLDPKVFPGLPDQMYRPGSTVFEPPRDLQVINLQWWHFIEGADWQHPSGPGSSIDNMDNHPVVQIAFEDAQAYAKWMNRALPTEAQFEYAAKGASSTTYPWGKSLHLDGKEMANTWTGVFPFQNTATDGFIATAPVGCFPQNAYHLFDMVGNVWEWVMDDWTPYHSIEEEPHPEIDLEDSLSVQARTLLLGTIKGGSFLCSPSYCKRYRPSARHAQDRTMGTNHIGSRTVSLP
jgi:formylglycine-generating enzyme required for sulfatase activity